MFLENLDFFSYFLIVDYKKKKWPYLSPRVSNLCVTELYFQYKRNSRTNIINEDQEIKSTEN